jgi:hypothetical protein
MQKMTLKQYDFLKDEYGDEWDNLQSQEYNKKHEINICENMILDEIFLNASNSQNSNMFTNNKKVELYHLTYEHYSKFIFLKIHNFCQ